MCRALGDACTQDIHIDTLDPGLVYAITAGRFYVKSGIPKALSAKVMDKWLSSLGTPHAFHVPSCASCTKSISEMLTKLLPIYHEDPDYRDAVILNRAYWLSAVELFDRLTEWYGIHHDIPT